MLEPARETDLAAVVDLVNLAYRGQGEEASWNAEVGVMEGARTTLAFLAEDLAAKPHAHLMVHREAGAVVGCVWLEPLADGEWYLSLFAIQPKLQGSQLGRRVLAEAEAYVAEHGGERVRMSVMNVRTSLIAWYERRGYIDTGETIPFPYEETRFGRPMRDDLAFVVLAKAL